MAIDIGLTGKENAEKCCMAYSLSKQFIPNEMTEIKSYSNLKFVEFYEYLGRLAYFVYPAKNYGDSYPLIKKIIMLL